MRSLMFAAILTCLPSSLEAEEISRCVIEVQGTSYLDGSCNFESLSGGSFTIGIKQRVEASPHFAYVLLDGPSATGYWNGVPPGNHAHDPLGQLKRDGACWVNDNARICALR